MGWEMLNETLDEMLDEKRLIKSWIKRLGKLG